MKKTFKRLASLVLVAAFAFGVYSATEKTAETATETYTTQGDPGGGPGV